MTLDEMIAVISLCITVFSLGYTLGSDHHVFQKVHWTFFHMHGNENSRPLPSKAGDHFRS